jgi:hypothetical protein
MVLNLLGENKTGGTTGINFGTHFFFSNLCKLLAKFSIYWNQNPFVCGQYSIIVTSPNLGNFETKIDKIFGDWLIGLK